jgi:hypothetical protein
VPQAEPTKTDTPTGASHFPRRAVSRLCQPSSDRPLGLEKSIQCDSGVRSLAEDLQVKRKLRGSIVLSVCDLPLTLEQGPTHAGGPCYDGFDRFGSMSSNGRTRALLSAQGAVVSLGMV